MKKTGTLVLIKDRASSSKGDVIVTDPIIICDDEIKEGDIALYKGDVVRVDEFTHDDTAAIFNLDGTENRWNEVEEPIFIELAKKVLVNTPQIPQNVIDAIKSGKLKDGTQVEVELAVAQHQHHKEENNPLIKDNKCIITWNKEVKQSPTYTEEENNVLLAKLSNDISEHLGHKVKHFIENWWQQNKKK
jgi:hypothetical protein